MKYNIRYRLTLDNQNEMIEFLEENGLEIDYLKSKINFKNVRDKKTKEYQGSIKVIVNDEDYESSEFQWWEAVPNQYVKINKASELTGLSVNYLRNLVQRGEIPHYKQGKFTVFSKEELIKWVENRTNKVEVKK